MWWQGRELLRHLIGEELLVVVKRADVDECEEAQLARDGIELKRDFTLSLLRV